MKKKIITITGLPGSGKSSTAKRVAHELGYEHFSSGDLFRKIAKERGLSIEEINIAAETQKSIDHEVDEILKKMGMEDEKFVIDSRLAFHWMPDAFKVFLDLDTKTAAERTYRQIQEEGRESETTNSIEETHTAILGRLESEKKRYDDLYSVDYMDKSHYDLIVNTSENDLEGVVTTIIDAYKKHMRE